MKSICPHCQQTFPELPDNYLGKNLKCPTCKLNFICENPKYCPDCGNAMPASAAKCGKCGKLIQPPQPAPAQPFPQQPPQKKKSFVKGCLIVTAVLGLLAVIAVVILLAFLSVIKDRMNMNDCSQHMADISTRIKLFADNNRDQLPPDLGSLKDYCPNDEIFRCPTTRKQFIYLGKGLTLQNASGDLPILLEHTGNHLSEINILHFGGHVSRKDYSRPTESCEELLNEFFPDLNETPAGRIVLNNARQHDGRIIAADSIPEK